MFKLVVEIYEEYVVEYIVLLRSRDTEGFNHILDKNTTC